MAEHSISHLVAILLALAFFVAAMVFSALAAQGLSPFLASTGNVSDEYNTQITPSGWTFAIWSIIYAFMAAILVYAFSGLCRKNSYGYVYCSPAVLPLAFFVIWCLNLTLNVGWLLLWDRGMMIIALVFLILIVLTNYTMIFFSCHGLSSYGEWLNKHSKADLWLHRIVVQNGIAIYATWTTIATLINLTIVLVKDAKLSQTDAATVSLSVLSVVLLVWFLLENLVLDKHVRYILIIYPAVIWALTGVFTNNFDSVNTTYNNAFIATLLAAACALCVTRFGLVIWRHFKSPLYEDFDATMMSPTEMPASQKTIFK